MLSSAPDSTSEPDDVPKNQTQKPNRGKFMSIFLEKHKVLGMLCDRYGSVSRAEKLTIVLV